MSGRPFSRFFFFIGIRNIRRWRAGLALTIDDRPADRWSRPENQSISAEMLILSFCNKKCWVGSLTICLWRVKVDDQRPLGLRPSGFFSFLSGRDTVVSYKSAETEERELVRKDIFLSGQRMKQKLSLMVVRLLTLVLSRLNSRCRSYTPDSRLRLSYLLVRSPEQDLLPPVLLPHLLGALGA